MRFHHLPHQGFRRTAIIAGLIAAAGTWAMPALGQSPDLPTSLSEDEDAPTQQPRRRGPRPDGERGPRPDAPPAGPAAEENKDKAKDKKPEKDRYLVIKGATVHTVTRGTLADTTIVCKNGKIWAMGRDLPTPEGAEVLEAAGFDVFPGLVAVRTAGVVGGEPPDDTSDVYALNMVAALAGGMTTVVSGNTAAKVTFGTLEDHVLRRNLFENLRYRTSEPESKRRLRESLEKGRRYIGDVKAYEDRKNSDPNAAAPDDKWAKGEGASALRLLKGEVTAITEAQTAGEMLQLCDLAETYGLRLVIRGGREAWTIPTQLSRAKVSLIIVSRESTFFGPTYTDQDKRSNRPTGGSIQTASILHDHGVPFAINTNLPTIAFNGLGGRDLLQLNLEAALAVRGGLPNEAALRSITIDAARVLGVDERVGSIEVGKDADFAVVPGDILKYTTQVRWTVVNGRIAYDQAKETLLNHIRPPDADPATSPPPSDYWPRRLTDPIKDPRTQPFEIERKAKKAEAPAPEAKPADEAKPAEGEKKDEGKKAEEGKKEGEPGKPDAPKPDAPKPDPEKKPEPEKKPDQPKPEEKKPPEPDRKPV